MKPKYASVRSFFPTAMTLSGLVFALSSAHAANLYWDSNGTGTAGAGATPTGTWGTSIFWSTDSTGANIGSPTLTDTTTALDDLFFSAGTDAVNPYTVTLTSTQNAKSLTFEEGAATISGTAGIITLGGIGNITVGSGLTATIGSNTTANIGGSVGLTKLGTGILTLNGSAVNTFTGGLNVNAGTLALDYSNFNGSQLINSGNALTIGSGGTFNLQGNNTAAAANVQTFNGTTLSTGRNNFTITKGASGASVTANLGALTVNAGSVTTITPGAFTWATATPSTTERVFVTSFNGNALPAGATKVNVNAGLFYRQSASAGAARWVSVDSAGQLQALPAAIGAQGLSGTVTVATQISTANITLTGSANSYGLVVNSDNAARTLNLGTTSFTYTINGILGVNANKAIISPGTGGTIVIGSEKNLLINMDHTGGVDVNAPIVNNGGGASAVTIASTAPTGTTPGTVTFGATNTFTGRLSVVNSTLSIASINNVSANGVLGNNALSVILGGSNGQTGTLAYTAATGSSTKLFTLTTGGTGALNVSTALTLSGTIDGGGSLSKLGAGALTLSGTNTFTGNVDINAGTLAVGVAGNGTNSALGSVVSTRTINVNSTGTLRADIGNIFSNSFAATNLPAVVITAGTMTNGGAATNSALGNITLTGGTLTATTGSPAGTTSGQGFGSWNLNGTVTSTGTSTISSTTGAGVPITLNATSGLSSPPTIFDVTSGTLTASAVLGQVTRSGNETVGSLTKSGAGTMTLSGSNTYTGATQIDGGTLVLSNATALGGSTPGVNGTSSISMGANTTLQSNYAPADAGITDSYVYAPITLTAAGTNNFFIGNGNSTAPAESVRFNLNGAIGGTAGANVVFGNTTATRNNADSIIVLGASSTYNGNTTIQAGFTANRINVIAGVANALPVTTVLSFDATAGSGSGRTTQFDLNGNNQTLAGLDNGGTVASLRNIRVTNTGALATLTINNTADSTFGGANGSQNAQIAGSINLTKNGAGTFTLAAGAGNAFTGETKILGGILSLGQSTSIQNSPFDTTGSIAGNSTNGLRITPTTLTLGGLTGGNDFSSRFTATTGGYGSLTALTLNPGTAVTNSYGADIGDGAGGMTLTKSGAGTQVLAGVMSHTGSTTVNAGTLTLDYSTQDNSKLSDTAALILAGGTLNLSGGTHTETVLSTSLTGLANVTRTSGSAVLQMNTITPGTGSIIFGAESIATTDNLNNGYGILGTWATINGGFLAVNSTNTADGLITAAISSDVTRLNGGSQVIPDSSTTNIRIIEGTGTAANIALGAATTTVNTLFQSATGGISGAIIDSGTQTLRTNAIVLATGAGALTIGNGTLTPSIPGGVLELVNYDPASAFTVNSVIDDFTSTSSLSKSGLGSLTLTGSNTYSSGTTLSGGILTAGNNSALGGGTLAFSGTGVRLVLTDGLTIANNITIGTSAGAAGRGVIENSGAGNATLSGGIITINNLPTAGGHFASTGGGTLTIADAINSASTPVYWRAGTGIFSGGGSYSNFTVLEGTVRLAGHDGLSTSATVDIGASAAGTLDLAGFNQSLAGMTKGGSAATIGNSSITTDSLLTTTGTSSYAGTITDVLSPGTRKVALTVNGGSLTLGSTATNYTGDTTISSGALVLSSTTAFASAVTVNGGTTLQFSPTATSSMGSIGDISLVGTLTYAPATNSFQVISNITNNKAVTVSGGSSIINISPVGAFAASTGGLYLDGGLKGSTALTVNATVNGFGLIVRRTNNTYSGTMTVNGTASPTSGTGSGLAIGVTGTSLQNANLTLNGTLELGDNVNGMGWALSSGGGVNLVSGTTVSIDALNGTGVVVGNMATAASTRTLSVGNSGGTGTFSGAIANGTNDTLSFTKAGIGTQTLSGLSNTAANNYTGTTTIDNGTLAFTTTDPTLTGGLVFGLAAGSTNVGALDLSGIASTATFGNLIVQTDNVTANTITLGSGKTLTFTGAIIDVGINNPVGTVNKLTVGGVTPGVGSLAVNNSAAVVRVGVEPAADQAAAGGTLDLTTLGSVSLGTIAAPITTLRVGGRTTSGVLFLSDTSNVITATNLILGDSNGGNAGGTNIINLGTGTNVINADTINIGFSKATATLKFASQASGSPGTVTIVNKAGANGLATLNIGSQDGSNTGTNLTGNLDLRGHVATVNAGVVNIGRTNGAGAAGSNGILRFDAGTFDATSLNLGIKSSTGTSSNLTNSVNIGGGVFTVSGAVAMSAHTGTGATGNVTSKLNITNGTVNLVSTVSVANKNSATSAGIAAGEINVSGGALNATGVITLATQASAGTATGLLNITGGAVTSNSDIVDGGGATTTTLTLDGGSLNMTGKNIGGATAIDVLNFRSGTLSNVAAINGTGGLTKTTGGTLTLSGTNTYTGNTTVDGGILAISNAFLSDVADVSVAVGASMALNYSGTDTIDELFIDGNAKSPGTYGATGSGATNIDNVHFTGSGTLTVTTGPPADPYLAWSGIADFNADTNGDGVKNGLAWLLGAANKNENAINRLPAVTVSGGGLVMSFNCLPLAARGSATLKVSHSSDLAIWTPTVDVVPDADDAVPDNNVTFVVGAGPAGPPQLNTVTATIDSAAAAAGKLFGRLEAVTP